MKTLEVLLQVLLQTNEGREGVVSVIFDGIGTQLISIVISILVGGVAGYQIGIRKRIKQKQISGDESSQIQIGDMSDSIVGKKKEKINVNTTIRQSQKAGEKANQYQVGVKQKDE